MKLKKNLSNSDFDVAIFTNLETEAPMKLILDDLDLILKNSDVLEEEINKREELLKGTASYSEIKNDAPLSEKLSENIVGGDLLSENELFNMSENSAGKTDTVYQVSSSCFSGIKKPEPLYIYKIPIRDTEVYVPKLADDNYYETISGNHPLITRLLDNGYKFIPVVEGATYRCNDLEYQPTLFALDYFYTNHKEHKIFQNITGAGYFSGISKADQELISKAKEIEGSFFSQLNPSDANLSILGNFYLKVYDILKNQDNISDGQKEKDQDGLLLRYLIIKDKMSNIQYVFNSNLYFDNLVKRADLGLLGGSKMNYYPTRSFYSLTYFNFSPLVWRIEEKPKYLTETSNKAGERIIDYKKAIDLYGKDEVLKWNKITEKVLLGESDF